MDIVARLEPGRLTPERELEQLASGAGDCGALVSFVGIARGSSDDGSTIERLVLDHHPRLTQKSLDEIAAACGEAFGVERIRIVHRCGAVAPGEPIVFAGAAAAHRRAAFDAADYLMDRLKTEAVFWKREETAAGWRWIEPRASDYADRERWR